MCSYIHIPAGPGVPGRQPPGVPPPTPPPARAHPGVAPAAAMPGPGVPEVCTKSSHRLEITFLDSEHF